MLNLIINNMCNIEKAAEATWNFFNGKFGHYRLVQPYRKYWQMFWVIFNVFVFVRFILFPLFGLWDNVSRFLNVLIWG